MKKSRFPTCTVRETLSAARSGPSSTGIAETTSVREVQWEPAPVALDAPPPTTAVATSDAASTPAPRRPSRRPLVSTGLGSAYRPVFLRSTA
jgi:hypothetical protein